MTAGDSESAAEEASGNPRLAILLSMAMFVLVVDTSVMNVSIAAVVDDLGTTVSGVQSAIAIEALVSAAFILIGSKVGDLIGRKRAYVLGPACLRDRRLGDGTGPEPDSGDHLLGGGRWAGRVAVAARDAVADPRQLRRGGSEKGLRVGRGGGRDRRRSRAAARRLHHHVSVVADRVPARGRDHRDRPVQHQARPRRALHGARGTSTSVGAVLSVVGMGGIVLGILVWQEGGEAVGALLVLGAISLGGTGLLASATEAAGESRR